VGRRFGTQEDLHAKGKRGAEGGEKKRRGGLGCEHKQKTKTKTHTGKHSKQIKKSERA
jgi:hypothetical protein